MSPTKKKSSFEQLNDVNVQELVESKGQFTYLSWSHAATELLKKFPDSTWEVHEYQIDNTNEKITQPYMKTDTGYFVKVTVTVEGVPATQVHPVLDHQNKPILKPNAFQINTSIQRCLAKTIALHGLGIHLYAGEDLPAQPPLDDEQAKELLTLLKDNKKEDLLDTVKHQISLGEINQGNFQKAMEHYTNS